MSLVTLQRAFEIAVEHHQAGRFGEAESTCRQILAVDPNQPGALHLLGLLAHTAGQHADAVTYIQRALSWAPNDPSAWSNLGQAHLALGCTDEALAHFRHALALDSCFTVARFNLANALRLQGQLDEAVSEFRRVLELAPQNACALSNLSATLAELGQLDEAIATCRQALQLLPREPVVHSNLISLLRLHPTGDPRLLAEALREWNFQFAEPWRGSLLPHTNSRDPERRLRIGYVSPDFRIHATLFFLAPLFREHDHRRFEIHCRNSSGDTAFTDPCVPTGMNIGVSTTPWFVTSRPRRAFEEESVLRSVNMGEVMKVTEGTGGQCHESLAERRALK